MKKIKTIFLHCIFLLGLSAANLVYAQLRIETSGVGASQIPIAIAAFVDEGSAPQQITSIIRADLERSGYFRIIDGGGPIPESAAINFSDWKARGADALVVGSVQRLSDGRFEIRYKLLDTIKAATLSGFGQTAASDRLRTASHRIADDIYEKLIGIRGMFSTRVAYITKIGNQYRLEVADADGENAQMALRSTEPIISPAWSPDGSKLAYVSFENKKPVVYVQDLVTRQRIAVANYKGNNSAPAWSPDGTRLAVALSRDGLTQVYVVNADGSNLRRLTNSNAIDTEPQFSPDGSSIYFTSDRSGSPQIYRMSAAGGPAQRVTFEGGYNASPRISPDGNTLAHISRREGKYQLHTIDLNSGQQMRLSDAAQDESPSFAPNGRYIMYATGNGARGNLAVVSTDGRVRYRLRTQTGDAREPTWGPFMK